MSPKQTWTVTEPYLNLHCLLGEGPYYEKTTNSLRFVDIMSGKLHTVNLDEGPSSVESHTLNTTISVTADIEGVDSQEKIIIGAKYGLAVLDRKALRENKSDEPKADYTYISEFHPTRNERLRGNDGAADPHGRFWLGSMTSFNLGAFQREGGLFLFSNGKLGQGKKQPVTIPNSVSWSPDGKTMYFTQTEENTIYAYDYSSDEGAISNERIFYKHPDGEGYGSPDGHRVDVEGNVWSTFYGGGNVLKISPSGEVIGEIKLPTKNITCPEFVGTELFITTASTQDAENPTAEQKENGGALFRVDVGVQGLPHHLFKWDHKQ